MGDKPSKLCYAIMAIGFWDSVVASSEGLVFRKGGWRYQVVTKYDDSAFYWLWNAVYLLWKHDHERT